MNPLVDEISKFSLRFVFGKRYNRTNILFLPAVFNCIVSDGLSLSQ